MSKLTKDCDWVSVFMRKNFPEFRQTRVCRMGEVQYTNTNASFHRIMVFRYNKPEVFEFRVTHLRSDEENVHKEQSIHNSLCIFNINSYVVQENDLPAWLNKVESILCKLPPSDIGGWSPDGSAEPVWRFKDVEIKMVFSPKTSDTFTVSELQKGHNPAFEQEYILDDLEIGEKLAMWLTWHVEREKDDHPCDCHEKQREILQKIADLQSAVDSLQKHKEEDTWDMDVFLSELLSSLQENP